MNRVRGRCQALVGLAVCLAGFIAGHGAEAANESLRRLAQAGIEDLMNIQVTSVAGTPQARVSAPGALYVISADDIRRSGHRTIAEALRLVPGMYVGRINSASWLIGSRGLTGSSLTATRYLVLIDGRLVYDPLVSTTFWDTTDLILADVDRIEVIRGPGATLWGANAMNGVINIVTKSARDTVGTLAQVGLGSDGRSELDLRRGTALGGDSWLRLWGKYASFGDFQGPQDASLHDEWSTARAGFRFDKSLDGATTLTVQGNAYSEPTAMESVRLPVPGADRQFEQVTRDDTVTGASAQVNLSRGAALAEGWDVRAYYDQTRRDTSRFGVSRQTADVDWRAWSRWGGRNDLVWGADYLWTQDQIRNGPVLQFARDSRAWSQVNAFVQNTTRFADDKVFLMFGNKFTWHSFVGYESQPNVRLWWTPSDAQTLWASVSRPVRIPSRFEENGTLVLSYADLGAITTGTPNGIIVPLGVSGDDELRPEKLLAYELGHRIQVNDRWLFETSLFYNDYQRLIEPAATILGPFNDLGSGNTYGVELNSTARLTERWRLEGSYTWLRARIDGPVYQFEEKSSPRNMAQLRSYLDIGEAFEFNAALYFVDKVPQLAIDSYRRLDLGLGWRLNPHLRLELWGQNLLERRHEEASGAQVPRGVFALVSVHL
jgi:iron complex outermembrane receptor protein